jgi:hypothetical protein
MAGAAPEATLSRAWPLRRAWPPALLAAVSPSLVPQRLFSLVPLACTALGPSEERAGVPVRFPAGMEHEVALRHDAILATLGKVSETTTCKETRKTARIFKRDTVDRRGVIRSKK